MRAHRILISLFAALAAGSAAVAQPALPQPGRVAPQSAASMKQSFAPVVRRAAPAVVNISARSLVRPRTDPFWEFFGGGVPRARVATSLGSGVIVRPDGVIVTNNHVVQGGQEITVALADRREFPARILLQDPRADLAVLKIEPPAGERLPTLSIDDTSDTEVGDLVLAIGNPFGVGQTVTNGIISALNRSVDPTGGEAVSAYIQTDAAINQGNSGGALVDMDGDLIGINSFILSRSGTSSGVGFALPATVVRRVVETAVGGGRQVVRPWLGARLQSITPQMAEALGLRAPTGAVVGDLWPGGSAQRAGLRAGDVITSIDGQPATDAASVIYAIGAHRPGEPVRIEVLRGGRTERLTLRAEAPPATPARDERVIQGQNPFDGATVVSLSPALAEEQGLDPFGGGVLVTRVTRGYAANYLRQGDIIRAVNGRAVRTTGELQSLAGAPAQGWEITIERNGQTGTIRV
ncbi:Do family serine endopeptidase [Phenylobacterium sp.]|jgi:Do/DeqQ family serine protease|uniref:Do family serine endopeptidase n=1 Tax=Phenylobacterium sp. TaxID=1871053 RepID=UPI002F934836